MSPTTRRAALTALASASALAVPSALVSATPPASDAPLSPELRAAIDAHRLAQSNVDGHSGQPEEAFSALSDLEGEAHWKLAETPRATDADFLAKVAYLLRHEKRIWGELLSYDAQYGKLAFRSNSIWRNGAKRGTHERHDTPRRRTGYCLTVVRQTRTTGRPSGRPFCYWAKDCICSVDER
jgi:hypothetical protein